MGSGAPFVAAPADQATSDWRDAVDLAARVIADHPEVVSVSMPRPNADGTRLIVEAEIEVPLPLKWAASGASPNGVRADEPVTFSFSPGYPFLAPEVTLRDDFDRSLAHVMPGPAEGPVVPCLYEGRLSELMHNRGLPALVDHLVEWLVRAAIDALIDRKQGWEPVRRDHLVDVLVADGDQLRGFVSRQDGHVFLMFDYAVVKEEGSSAGGGREERFLGRIGSERLPVSEKILSEGGYFGQAPLRNGTVIGRSLAVLVTPGKLPSGALFVADVYKPETVTTLAELKDRATEYGCGSALNGALDRLGQCLRKLSSGGATCPLAIVLCARRPFRLIDDTSDIELVPYVTQISAPKLFPQGDATPVRPAGHRHVVTPALLKQMSGKAESPDANRDWVLVGCGSLGSKIGVHMARAGAAPRSAIDRSYLSPHNAARHGLLPQDDEFQLAWIEGKAQALADSIRGLGQCVEAHKEDVIATVGDRDMRKKLLPRRAWAVVDTTGSAQVRAALAAIAPEGPKWRVIETGLLADGTVGLMTVEGPGRNPNCEDLGAETYHVMGEDDRLHRKAFEDDHAATRQAIGQGCDSITVVMSDARVSAFAAAMSRGLLNLRRDGLPLGEGRLVIGTLGDDGMSLTWATQAVAPVLVVPGENGGGWSVRLSRRAAEKIESDCDRFPKLETGGVLMGRVSAGQRAFLVTEVLPAPSDSVRAASEFILGVRGLRRMIDDYSASCRGALYCLGSWHSHLRSEGPSPTDRHTATTLAVARALPSVLLIRTPSGHRALVAKQDTLSGSEGES